MFSARLVRQAASRVPMATRSYASAAGAASTKPPVPLFGVDGTYASALYTAAAKSSALEPTAKALETLAGVFKKDTKLQAVLDAPALTAEDKKQMVDELMKNVRDDKSGVVKNVLMALAENNRLGALEGVCEKFGTLMSASRGEIELVVTSAQPLDNKVLQKLESAISKSQYVGSGRKLKVVPKVNPDIRGGLIVEIGDRTIDLSVSSKMNRMNQLLREAL